MTDSNEELIQIADSLEQMAERARQEDIQQPLDCLKQAAEGVGKAWSGSWLGYQANVYYKDLQPPPPAAHFSIEWGLERKAFVPGTIGEWVQYDADDVKTRIHRLAGKPDLEPVRAFKDETTAEFRKQQLNLSSIVDVELGSSCSSFLTQLKEDIGNLSVLTERELIDYYKPKQMISRDPLAHGKGFWTPPHLSVLFEVSTTKNKVDLVARLAAGKTS